MNDPKQLHRRLGRVLRAVDELGEMNVSMRAKAVKILANTIEDRASQALSRLVARRDLA